MQDLSRWRQMHSLAMLFIGVSFASACWLTAGATSACAQDADTSTGTIRILKGSNPIEYTAGSAGIRLRLVKGVQCIDYVLRRPLSGPNPANPTCKRGHITPALPLAACERSPLTHTSVPIPSGTTAANKGLPAGTRLLSPIPEIHDVSASQCRRPEAEDQRNGKSCHSAFPISPSTSATASASCANPPGNNRPGPAPSIASPRLTKEKEATSSHSTPLASHDATPLHAPQQQVGPDGPDWKALHDIVVLQVIGTVSASLLVSLAIVVSVFVLLRRSREQMPALVQVGAPPSTPLAQSEMPPAPEFIAEEPTAQPFDLGRTFEEERRLKAEAEIQQERAVLRTIFENNLRLRQQLIEQEAAVA